MVPGRCRSLLPLLLLLPAARGDCGPLPHISHAEPPGDAKDEESFRVGFQVRYSCLPGYVKRPSMPDTVQCLANSQWSSLQDFCGRSCPSPPRVRFAKISQEDQMQNFYAVNTTVKYICRPGYENTTDQLLTSTCLDNLKWSEVPELCQRKSCGIPANPEHGKVLTSDLLFNANAHVICDPGYILKGVSTLTCSKNGTEVAWSELPVCEAISCPPPPAIPNGKHNGNGTEEFVYDSVVMYTCDPGLQLVGSETLRCTTENGVDGVWSRSPPECRAISCPPPPAIPNGKHNGNGTEEFVYDSVVMYTCDPGLQLVGSETLRCTTENGVDGVWSRSPPECRVSSTAATNETEPLEEKRAENPNWLAIILPICIVPAVVLGILAVIIMYWKDNKNQSYHVPLQKHKMKGRDPQVHPKVTDDEKQPVPWRSYFCHTTSCHVCPTCEERLHAALAPRAEPARRSCATCEDWLRAQPGSPCAHLVLSVDGAESRSPAGTSSPAKAADGLRGDSTEAVPERSEAEQPVDRKSDHHVCPTCENWLRAHLGQCDSRPAAPGERPGGPRRQDEGDAAACPVCPLAGEGTPAHLVPRHTPGCHVCLVCATPTHAHLCQPRCQAPDG